MNIKLLHHNNNVVSIINPKFQPIMTIILEVIAVLVSPYAFGIFSKKLLSTEGTYSEKLLSTQRVNIQKKRVVLYLYRQSKYTLYTNPTK